MSLKQLNVHYQIVKPTLKNYQPIQPIPKEKQLFFTQQPPYYINNKNVANSNVSQCSTSLEEDPSKPTPKKKNAQDKRISRLSHVKGDQNPKFPKFQILNKIPNPPPNPDIVKPPPSPKQDNKAKSIIDQPTSQPLAPLPQKQQLPKYNPLTKQLLITRHKINSDLLIEKNKQFFYKTRRCQKGYPTKQISKGYPADIFLLKKAKSLQTENIDKKILKKVNSSKKSIASTWVPRINKNQKLSDFQLGKELGKGKFGYVKLVKHKQTGLVFSMKVINKQKIKQDKIIYRLIQQIKIQNLFNHCHIAKLYSVFDDKENIYLLMELCTEGNLYKYIQKFGRISQKRSRQLLKQTCQAIKQLHNIKIVHRDIKPQNIVLSFGMVKLCDFGWSTQISDGQLRKTFCGSPLYISPQLLKKQLHDQKVDLWALGILGYQMLTGTIPFNINSERDLTKIVNQEISYPAWLSTAATSFLKKLLDKNPKDRSSIQQVLTHPFLKIPH